MCLRFCGFWKSKKNETTTLAGATVGPASGKPLQWSFRFPLLRKRSGEMEIIAEIERLAAFKQSET